MTAILLAGGCVDAGTFQCSVDEDCQRGPAVGVCEPSSFCSYPDDACETGRRYDRSSGVLTDQCVPGPAMSIDTTDTGAETDPGAGTTTDAGAEDETTAAVDRDTDYEGAPRDDVAHGTGAGEVDECETGFGVNTLRLAWAELTELNENCVDDDSSVGDCFDAANQYCETQTACPSMGLGPVLGGDKATILCVRAMESSESVSMDDLKDLGFADEFLKSEHRGFQAAVQAYCVDQGAVVGIGPLGSGDGTVTVKCMGGDRTAVLPFADTELIDAGCPAPTAPHDQSCTFAANRLCRDQGYQAGHGPVDFSDGSAVEIACLNF